jgi:hypothetical protein
MTRNLSFALSVIMGISILIWSLIQFDKLNPSGKWYLIFLLLINVFISKRIMEAREKASFAMVSLWLKIFMILGLFYILFWNV